MEFYALHRKYVDPDNGLEFDEDGNDYLTQFDNSYDKIINYYISLDKCKKDKYLLEEKRDEEKTKHKQCACCPIWNLTKRKYNNNPKKISGYCANYNIYYEGNSVSCTLSYPYNISMDEEYYIETIQTID